MGSYKLVGEAIRHTLQQFNWNVAGLLYYTYELSSLMGNSKCHFMLSAVYFALGLKPEYKSFQDTDNIESFKKLLTEMSLKARSECRRFIHALSSSSSSPLVHINNIIIWKLVRFWRFYSLCRLTKILLFFLFGVNETSQIFLLFYNVFLTRKLRSLEFIKTKNVKNLTNPFWPGAEKYNYPSSSISRVGTGAISFLRLGDWRRWRRAL